jgi:hypothetical protein
MHNLVEMLKNNLNGKNYMICCLFVVCKYDILLIIKLTACGLVFLRSLALFKPGSGGRDKEYARIGIHASPEKIFSLHNKSIHLTLDIYSNLRNGMTVKEHEKAEEGKGMWMEGEVEDAKD